MIPLSPGAEESGAEESGSELTTYADGTLGLRLYFLEYPGNVDGLTGFFDQYRYIKDKDGNPAYFIDFFHLDLGIRRDDDTRLLRVERFSPEAQNARTEIEFDGFGVELDVDVWRFRNDELRIFPREVTGTTQLYASTHTPDYDPANVSGVGKRLKINRTGLNGDLTFVVDDLPLSIPSVREVSFGGGYEERRGYRQDRFLLDEASGESVSVGTFYRANRRKIEQEVVNLRAGMVIEPFELFTGVLELNYESFEEKAPVVTLDLLSQPSQISPIDPDVILDPLMPLRAVHFVPDTHKISGSAVISRRIGEVSLHAGGAGFHLVPDGRRSPLQIAKGYDDPTVTTWSAYGAFDVPFSSFLDGQWGDRIVVDGRLEYDGRRNDIDPDAFSVASGGGQVNVYVRGLDRLHGGIELTTRIMLGTEAALGYRVDYTKRDLQYPLLTAPEAITPDVSLIREESFHNIIYARARARIYRGVRVSGELGFQKSPKVGMPRELESAVYFDGRFDVDWSRYIPISFGAHGKVISGDTDAIRLFNDPRYSKDLDLLRWNYSLQLTAVPLVGTSLYASWVVDSDNQDYSFLRSDVPRYQAVQEFFRDSTTHYASNVQTLVLGGTTELWARISAYSSLTWVWIDVGYQGFTSADLQLDAESAIDQKIFSFIVGLEYTPLRWLEFGTEYRFDGFSDGRQLQREIVLDEAVHQVSFSVRMTFNSPI